MSELSRTRVSVWGGVAALIGLLWLLYSVFRSLLEPMIWAAVLVRLFWPLHVSLRARLPRWRNLEALLVTFLMVLILILPALLLFDLVVTEAVTTYQRLDEQVRAGQAEWLTQLQEHPWVQWALGVVRARQEQQDLPALLLDAARQGSLFLAGQLSSIVGNVLVFLFHLGITILTAFFLFRDGSSWLRQARVLVPLPHATQEIVFGQISKTVAAVLYGIGLVAAAQGLLGGVGFWLIGLPSPVMWGAVMAALALIPILGAFLVWLPAALILLLQGSTFKGVFLIIWGTGVVGTVDNVLRPLLIGAQTRLPTLMVFLSLLGGIEAFGMIGVVLGPIAVAVTLALLDAYAATLEPSV